MSDYYAHLDVGPILEANKELQARVESLEQEIRELRKAVYKNPNWSDDPEICRVMESTDPETKALARNKEHPKMGVHRCPKCKKMIPDGEECHHCNKEQEDA